MVAIIDVAEDTTSQLSALWNSGIRAIIRYDSRTGHWKEGSNAEVAAILAHGMGVGIVNEGVGNRLSAFSEAIGYDDASYSLARAHYRNQPAGSAIYYAVDFDVSYAGIQSGILPYFAGVHKAHDENRVKWRIGCYCSGLCAGQLVAARLVDLTWITCSLGFAGSRAYVNAGAEDLWQYSCERTLCGLDVDYNLYPSGKGDWGQWAAGATPVPPPVPPPPAWDATWGPNTGKASWYSDTQNADGTPVNNKTDLSCACLKVPFGTKLKATRPDTGASVVVTVHDRGPYVTGRIIDFRPAAARALDMIDIGIAPIVLTVW